MLVVGTKVDMLDEKQQKKTNRNQQFSSEIGAEEIFVNCTNLRSFHAGSTDAVKLSKFLDKVIERKYFSQHSLIRENSVRKFTNIQSPVDTNRYVSSFTSPLVNLSLIHI